MPPVGPVSEQAKKLKETLQRCEDIAALNPHHPKAHSDLGDVLHRVRRYEDAIASFDRAIALDHRWFQAHTGRGNALLALKRFGEAVESYDRAIALNPDNVGVHNNRGNALKALRRFTEALDSYNRAITLLPDRAELYSNRGNALQELECFQEAIESYDQSIALKPDHAEAHSNRGVALKQLKRLDEAMASFDRALALRPDYAEASWNKALLCLLVGQFDLGWREYEARKRKKHPVGHLDFAKPLWLGGANISGKTILVHWEQGFGDVIQFSRYIDLLRAAGSHVLFAPQRPLQALMRGLHANVDIVDFESDHLTFDYHCPIMSLPLAFETDLNTIPRATYLSPDSDKVAAWARHLGKRIRPRVGVVWRGTAEPDISRTIPLEQFQRLFDPRFEFVSLQKHLTGAECSCLNRANVFHPGDALKDFSDTAALGCLMDVVISIDTSVAHLAGALGIPAWVLLPWLPDWRWMLDRDDSPWYPSMGLFRQQARGDWEGVLQRIRQEMQALLG